MRGKELQALREKLSYKNEKKLNKREIENKKNNKTGERI